MLRSTSWILAAGLLGFTASAMADVVALRHLRIIDGQSGTQIENATLVIEDGRIAALGPDASVSIPKGAREIDSTGKSVLPGLISDHSHVGLTDGVVVGPQNYTRVNVERQLKQWQRFGVTTVTSLGMNAPAFLSLREAAHEGRMRGADLFGADRGFGVEQGAPPVKVGADQLYRPRTVEEARAFVRDSAKRKPDVLKIWVDDFNHTLEAKMKPEIYTAIIDEAHKLGLRVAAHVYYLDDARKLVDAGVDILAHGIRDRSVDASLIKAMKTKGTWYIATLDLDEAFYVYAQQPEWMRSALFKESLQPELAAQFNDAAWRQKILADTKMIEHEQSALATGQRNLKALFDGGVKIGFGTDSGANPLRIPGFAEHRELQLMVAAGLTPMQAIRIATSQAAALLGLDDRGVLAAGKRADLLVVEGDPSRDIGALQRIDSVWQRGAQVAVPIAP